MNREENAMARLTQLVTERATGELVAVSAHTEVHVYLVSGRIAWGTTSSEPFAFRRRLVEQGLEPSVMSALVEECLRTRRPLGETLVDSGLMTFEQVRYALRSQVEAALATLAGEGALECVFLRRSTSYATYDPRLTFDVNALDAEEEVHA